MNSDFYSTVTKAGYALFSRRQSDGDVNAFRRTAYDSICTALSTSQQLPNGWQFVFCDLFHFVRKDAKQYEKFTCYDPDSRQGQAVWEWFKQNPFSLAQLIFERQTEQVAHVLSSAAEPSVATIPKHLGFTALDSACFDSLLKSDPKCESAGPYSVPTISGDITAQGLFRNVRNAAEGFGRFHVMTFYTFGINGQQNCWYFYIPYWTAELGTYSGTAFGFRSGASKLQAQISDVEELVHFLKPISDHWARYAHLYQERVELNKHRRATSRAAVFARNFSHVTGSHVVSNPDFRQALVGRSLQEFRGQLDASWERFERIVEDYLRNGFECDPIEYWERAREVLGRARHDMRTGGALTENSRRFHAYLQGRFDFIARAIDETEDQPEPIFFVEDVIEGFLAQTALIDTFVADLGVRLPDLVIEVRLPNKSAANVGDTVRFETHWTRSQGGAWQHEWVRTEWMMNNGSNSKIADHAILVALPGGMIAAHAFYSLIENIIRNSVKYGKDCAGKPVEGPYRLVIQLDTEKGTPGLYTLRIGDNHSFANAPEERANVKMKVWKCRSDDLDKDFIDWETGKAQTKGLGMLEMKASADALRGKSSQQALEALDPTDNQATSLESDTNERGDNGKWLTYRLWVRRPLLVAIFSKNRASETRTITGMFDSLERVFDQGAHILVINGENQESVDALNRKLSVEVDDQKQTFDSCHCLLPYRILVLKKHFNDTDKGGGPSMTGTVLRRIHEWRDSDLYERVFTKSVDGQPKTQRELGRLSTEERLVIDVYEAWLRAWKTPLAGRDRWDVWIGLERPPSYVKEQWEVCLGGLHSSLMDVFVRGKVQREEITLSSNKTRLAEMQSAHPDSEKSETNYWETELKNDISRKRALVFDNHGSCFGGALPAEQTTDFSKGTRFYQKLTGSGTPDLFRTLSHPPANPFAFAFYMHGLVEACLANVMILDERLASSLLFESDGIGNVNPYFETHLAEHQKAGVFPMFTFRNLDDESDEKGHFKQAHRMALVERVCKTGDILILRQEGVRFREDQGNTMRVLRRRKKQMPVKKREPEISLVEEFELLEVNSLETNEQLFCDVLVVHEGALDLLAAEVGWTSNLSRFLWQLSPSVVRTSGRGRETNHLYKRMPFIEFNEISSAVLTARNKIALVRGLLGTSGTHESV